MLPTSSLYGGVGGPGGYNWPAPRNPYLANTALLWVCLLELPLSILILVAQVGLYQHCSWNASCLVLPTFIACLLFIVTSIIGIGTALTKTNGMIVSLLVVSIITIIVTPINMALWALKPDQGGIPLKLHLVKSPGVSELLVVINWAILFLPIIVWIMSIIVATIASFALKFSTKEANPYSRQPAMNPGYGPSPVYGGFPPPNMGMGRPPRKVRPYPYY